MATATEERPASETADNTPPITPAAGERFMRVPLVLLEPSKLNPRKHFDDARLADLAKSVRARGEVLVPLLLRPTTRDKGRFEVVDGERRLRAAKLAGVIDVPGVIRNLSDAEVLEIQLISAIQRQDLTPLEEAAGYKALIESKPSYYSPEYIADKIGRTAKYVWDRMKLLDGIPDVKELLEQERILVGHAEQLARLKPEDQKRAIRVATGGWPRSHGGLWRDVTSGTLDFENAEHGADRPKSKYDGVKAVTIEELRAWIADNVRFDVQQAAAAAPLDFGPVAQQVETALAKPGRAKKVVSITHDMFVKPAARTDERVFSAKSWKRADGKHKSKPCEKSVLGVVVVGPEQGRAFDVCVNKDCDVHWAAEKREREKRQRQRDRGPSAKSDKTESADARAKRAAKEQREADERRRQAERENAIAVAAILEAARTTTTLKGASLRMVAQQVLYGDVDNEIAKALAKELGVSDQLFGYFGAATKQLEKLTDKQAWQVLVAGVLGIEHCNDDKGFAEACKAFGVDLKKVGARVNHEFEAAAKKAAPAKAAKNAKAKK